MSTSTEQQSESSNSIIEVENVSFCYGQNKALNDVSLSIEECKITSIIGPSGCGKTTLIRCLNRLNDLVQDAQLTGGKIRISGFDIYAPDVDPIELRKKVGMVFQKSNPFPMSIYENVAYGLKVQGIRKKSLLDEAIEKSLHSSALWDEVKDRLHSNALSLSGGQQQRLCIARALAVEPMVMLMDEPCSALDPIATAKVEELLFKLKENYTILIVTHSMQQAARLSDFTVFLCEGMVEEYGPTQNIFMNPSNPKTEAYISGRFG